LLDPLGIDRLDHYACPCTAQVAALGRQVAYGSC